VPLVILVAVMLAEVPITIMVPMMIMF